MKMKAYIQPATQVLPVQSSNEILSVSTPGVSTGDGLGNEFDEGDVTYSNGEIFGGSAW